MNHMSLRESAIRPSDEDPFKEDLLDRRELVESVAGALDSFRESHVVAINGGYGRGKTTVLRFLQVLLRERGFGVAFLNAWEHDHRHPLESLVNAAGSAFGERDWRRSLKATAMAVLPDLVAEFGPPGTRSLGEQFLRGLMPDSPPLEEFRRRLKNAVKAREGRIVFLIDELDRCRPDHAVGILEWSKHAFSIDGVHFVLGVHLDQLRHTVEKLYGSGFDGIGYLDRFMHMSVSLPPTSVAAVVKRELERRGTSELLARRDHPRRPDDSIERLNHYLVEAKLDARAAIRAVALFDATLRMLPEEGNRLVFVDILAVMVLLKTAVPASYSRFASGEASDLDVARDLERIGFLRKELRSPRRLAWFHAYLIHAHREIARDLGSEVAENGLTPLLQELQSRAEQDDKGAEQELEGERSLSQRARQYGMNWNSLGTLFVLKRIEWLAPF